VPRAANFQPPRSISAEGFQQDTPDVLATQYFRSMPEQSLNLMIVKKLRTM
jgi:hypothetical protein